MKIVGKLSLAVCLYAGVSQAQRGVSISCRHTGVWYGTPGSSCVVMVEGTPPTSVTFRTNRRYLGDPLNPVPDTITVPADSPVLRNRFSVVWTNEIIDVVVNGTVYPVIYPDGCFTCQYE